MEKFSVELHEAEKYDSSPKEKTMCFRLSEEDVSHLRRSWALDQYADAGSIGPESMISDCPILEFSSSSRANEGIAALETKKQPGRTSPASLELYPRSGSFSSSSVDGMSVVSDHRSKMELGPTELMSSASHGPASHMTNSHVRADALA